MKNGKIINNFECYIGAILNSEEAKKAEIGQKVIITLSNSYEINAQIQYIAKQQSGKVLIIFNLKTLTQDLIEYRKISFNITWWSFSGLKAPNESIIEDQDGNKYVIRKKSGEEKKILIKLLKRNDKYSIISSFNNEELEKLGINIKDYAKISEHDSVLLYPEINKNYK